MSMYPDPKGLEERVIELEKALDEIRVMLATPFTTVSCPHTQTRLTKNDRLFCDDCKKFVAKP